MDKSENEYYHSCKQCYTKKIEED